MVSFTKSRLVPLEQPALMAVDHSSPVALLTLLSGVVKSTGVGVPTPVSLNQAPVCQRSVARGPPNVMCTRSSSGRPGISLLGARRSEEHTSELQSHVNLVCRLLLEK